MHKHKLVFVSFSLILLFVFSVHPNPIQKKKDPVYVVPPVLLTRTTTRHENARLGYGSTVTIVGAPKGSITVEGWQKSEVDLVAEVELQAETEADLDQLGKVNTFVFDVDLNHINVLTSGTHDREFMKKVSKNFPKRLLNLPWKVDYHLRVPISTDVEINAGHGPVTFSGVEGATRLSATESDATLTLAGGFLSVTIAAGTVRLIIPTRSWRGSGADVRLAAGILNVEVPSGFSADIDADILRTGKIVSTIDDLSAREKPGITETVIRGRAGAGGAAFKFTVGDGAINLIKQTAAVAN